MSKSCTFLHFLLLLFRVTYLCLGDVVYTGATRMMLDYFRAIGFPCPELENPLMYYRKMMPQYLMVYLLIDDCLTKQSP